MKAKTVEEIVKEILFNQPNACIDDFRLYGYVLKNIGVDTSIQLREFLWIAKNKNYPSFESVSRARRKIFEDYPELQPLEMKLKREEKEREYIRYSRGE